jgi:hypothetical protein
LIAENVIRTAIVLPLRITRGVIEFGLGLLPGSSDAEPAPAARTAPSTTYTRGPGTLDAEPPRASEPPRTSEPPEHVEAEAELVAEAADAEAPDAPPGPELHVDEPWKGYRRMKVDEILSRLEGQPPEVLAAVELYETTHRHRGAVLNAVRSATRP